MADHELSDYVKSHLIHVDGVPTSVVAAIATACHNASVNRYAAAYAHGMEESYQIYGLDGVKTNVMYLLNNLQGWKGDEAKECKKILKKWTK